MKTVTMTTDPPATAPEENADIKLFTHTESTATLPDLKYQITDLAWGMGIISFFTAPISAITLVSVFTSEIDLPIFGMVLLGGGSVLGLGSIAGMAYSVFKMGKLRNLRKEMRPQATAEISTWLQTSYGVKVSDNAALDLAQEMSVSSASFGYWKQSFEDETGEQYNLRCNREGLFYIEKADGQKVPPAPYPSTVKSITAHPSTSAVTKADAQLLESIQTKADSLLTDDTSAETKTIVQQVTAEAVKAVELNKKLAKFNSKTANSKLSSTLQVLSSELDWVLEKEAAAVQREMEEQNLYVRSRPQTETSSKLKLNS